MSKNKKILIIIFIMILLMLMILLSTIIKESNNKKENQERINRTIMINTDLENEYENLNNIMEKNKLESEIREDINLEELER